MLTPTPTDSPPVIRFGRSCCGHCSPSAQLLHVIFWEGHHRSPLVLAYDLYMAVPERTRDRAIARAFDNGVVVAVETLACWLARQRSD